MYSLILSLILACGETEVDKEQLAKEQAQKELEKQRNKRMFQLQKNIHSGSVEDGIKQGLRLYKETSDKKIILLLKQAAQQVRAPEASLEALKTSSLPADAVEEIEFLLLLQKSDKQEAAAFAASVSNEEHQAAYLIEALRAGAVIESQNPFVLAAARAIKKGDISLLDTLPDLETNAGMIAFTRLALDFGSAQASKYAQNLQAAKDPRSNFYGLLAEEKLKEALEVGFKQNLFVDGARLIEKMGDSIASWNILLQARSPFTVLKKGSWELIPYATAAMKLGEYSTANSMFAMAKKKRTEVSQSLSEEENYNYGLASFFLRDVQALEALAKEESDKKAVFEGFLQMAKGKAFPRATLETMSAAERVSVITYTAFNDIGVAEQLLPQAIADADALGDMKLRIVTRLQHESYQRSYKGESTVEFLDQMNEEFGAAYPNLRTEIAIRKYLQGAQDSLELGADASVSERAWQSYLGGAIPSTMDPIPLMLSAMQILKQRKGYEKFINIMWQKTPIHRIGPLSTGTVLDLSHGLLFDDAVTIFVGSKKLEEVAQCLIFQDLARRGELLRKEGYHNRNPLLNMEARNREVLMDAVSQVRLQMQDFWMGAEFPQEAISNLHQVEARLVMDDEEAALQKQKRDEKKKEEALKEKTKEKVEKAEEAKQSVQDDGKKTDSPGKEENIGSENAPSSEKEVKKKAQVSTLSFFEQRLETLREDFSYRALVLKNRMDLNFLQSNFRKVAILSYREHKGSLIGVAFSDSLGQVQNLGSAEKAFQLSGQQKELLLKDRDNPTILSPDSASHKIANSLKNQIFEPFNYTTQRLVSMVFIAPRELEQMSFGTLPDQQNGLRFLNGMRRVSSVPGLSELLRSSKLRNKKLEMLAVAEEVKNENEPDLLRSGKENQPVEVDQISLSFKSGDRKVLIGDTSSLKEYRKEAPMARFIFFAQAKSSDAGGFLLNGEELTLSEMATMTLKAKLVLISAHPDDDIQRRRVHALLNAGARNIIVFDWPLSNKRKRAVLDKMFESLLRDEPIAEALAKISKLSLGLTAQQGVKSNGPGSWGALHLYGYPDRIGN